MIRMLEDLTGIDAQQIPLDEPTVMSLFLNTSALGVEPEDLGGCPLGSLGIPEFGTDFVIQMLIDTKPQSFFRSDPYSGSVPWYGRVVRKCTDPDRRGKSNDLHGNLHA